MLPSVQHLGLSFPHRFEGFDNSKGIHLDWSLAFDWETDLQEDLSIFADGLAVRTDHLRVKLSNKRLEDFMVFFSFWFFEEVVEEVEEVDQEIVGIVLLVSFELSYIMNTEGR